MTIVSCINYLFESQQLSSFMSLKPRARDNDEKKGNIKIKYIMKLLTHISLCQRRNENKRNFLFVRAPLKLGPRAPVASAHKAKRKYA